MTDFKTLRLELGGPVASITFSRPDLRNRLDFDAHVEVEQALRRVEEDQDARALIIAGEGKHFSAGGDLAELERLRADPRLRREMFTHARWLVQSILDLDIPVIAAVQGMAVGLGASIALLCDMVVAAPDSGFSDPHVAMGLVAGDGGVAAWPLAAGLMQAKRYLLTGEAVDGAKAERLGLITDLVDSREQIPEKSRELAEKVAALAPQAVRATKRALNTYAMREMAGSLELAMSMEQVLMDSEDTAESIAAAREKRKPQYKGR